MTPTYDARFVVLSVIVATLASFAALDFGSRVRSESGTTRLGWIAGGAFVMGLGIWSMHFIGMLAHHLPVAIEYDVPLMLLSVVVAIAASLLALIVISRPRLGLTTLLPAGVLMGGAIAGMHYIGMASMRAQAHLTYRSALVALSILIAIVASLAALWLAFTFRSDTSKKAVLRKSLSAMVMGVAISGMHYTAMAAVHFERGNAPEGAAPHLLASDGLGGAVVVSAILIIIVALIGVVIDRNLQARAAFMRQIAESELRIRLIVDTALDAVVTMDATGRITEWNAQAERMFGWSRAEAVGRLMADTIIPVNYRDAHDAGLKRFLRSGEGPVLNRRIEITAISRDSDEFPVELAISPARVGASWTFNAFIRDLTERNKAVDALRQASRMEAVGQLAGGVAHDFNNLLTVIVSYSSMLMDRLDPGDPSHGDVSEIAAAADRAVGLTRQLLAFSRQQVMQLQVINVNSVITDLQNMLRRLIGEDIELRTSLDPGVARINADPGQLEQVLMNLVVNARDAMPHGGRLSISTANANFSLSGDSGNANVTDAACVLLTVSDTGAGISPEHQRRLFDPFFTTKEQGRGTGLGLSTVYGIVKQSGGEIRVQSEGGKGTTFNVYFPRTNAPEERRPDIEATEVPRGSERVLIVEDDDNLRALAARVLETFGYQVMVANGGAEALALAADPRTLIDLVLTDVVMPDMNGRELVEKLLERRPDVSYLFMSGYTDDEVLRRGVLHGEAEFLQKPFTPPQLARKVRDVLDRVAV